MAETRNHLSPAEGVWSLRRLPDMDEAQFNQWQTLLEHRTGIILSSGRKSFLETNLGIRMREIGCSSYQAYYEMIVSGPDAVIEWSTLVDRLTVQETRFFRDPDAFRLVSDYVLTRPREQLKKRPLERSDDAAQQGKGDDHHWNERGSRLSLLPTRLHQSPYSQWYQAGEEDAVLGAEADELLCLLQRKVEQGLSHLDEVQSQGSADKPVAADLGVEGVGQGASQGGEIEDEKGGEDQSVEE